MQNVGVVNDHAYGCFRATDYRATGQGPGYVGASLSPE